MRKRIPTDAQKAAAAIRRRKYYLANRERLIAASVAWNRDPKNKGRRMKTVSKWRIANPEKVRDYEAKYAERNPEKIRAKKARWSIANKEKRRTLNRNWTISHRQEVRDKNRRRKATIQGRVHPLHDKSQELAISSLAKSLAAETGIAHHVDHIIPLAHGGWHHHLNLQVLPESVNRQKWDNPFWQSDGFKSWRDVPQFLWPETLKQKYLEILSKEASIAA